MRITREDLKDLSEIVPIYSDEVRESNHAVGINGFVVSGVYKFKIAGDIIVVCDDKDLELARICIDTLDCIEVDENFGDFKFMVN
jgi:hypothetical protein